MTASKVPLFAGLDALAGTAPARKPVSREQVDELAAANDFPSREPVASGQPSDGGRLSAGGQLSATPLVRPRRRYTTGRNVQLNIKATPATVQRMGELADKLNLPLGVVLERALEALSRCLC